jgi:S1-C subfamily serine protease
MYKKRFPIMSLFLVGVLMLAALACGGTTSSDAETDEGAAQTGGAVNTLEGVQQAVIQIEYLGSYRDPAIGAVSVAGFGSGFIIDPSGIAVTNNHVVAGAASLKIRIGGDKDKTYNAKILGVSECSDLAVIDIEGEGFPYLQWYDGEIPVGMNVYAVGFPLGEPEYTLTRGVVSKASASGETAWASIDGVIGHDATINPGNSGGPLVTEDGKVVGVNYRSRPDYDQYFAISVEKAVPLTAQLSKGENVDSIGVNGQAVVSDDKTLSGVWVSSVVSGSAADKTGIQGGDVITFMEGVQLAKDGTLADYCDVLRSHEATDTLSVNVLRFDSKEGLEGQINGTPLAQAFSFQAGAESAGESNSGSGSLVKFNAELKVGGVDGGALFTFLGITGGKVLVYVKPEANLDVTIALMDTNNAILERVNDAGVGGTERFSHTITGATGAYKIVVFGETAGNYEGVFIGSEQVFFKLDPRYLIAGSTPAGESVGYSYVGKKGETLNLLVTSDSKAPIDARVRIYEFGDLKTALAEANNSGNGGMEALTFPIPVDGVYIITVGDAAGKAGSFLMVSTTK